MRTVNLCQVFGRLLRDFNILLLKKKTVGDGATGKTCCLHVFTKGVFPERYVPTVFDTTIVDLEVTTKKGTKEPVRMSLWVRPKLFHPIPQNSQKIFFFWLIISTF